LRTLEESFLETGSGRRDRREGYGQSVGGAGIVEGEGAEPSGDAASLTVRRIDGHPFAPFQVVGDPVPLGDVRLLSPVLPSKVIGIGRNYADHAQEMDRVLGLGMGTPADAAGPPVVFLKPSTSVIGPGDAIQRPNALSDEVHYEGELAVVIARLCREVPLDRVPDVVLGFTCGNDVTARDLQRAEAQWGRAKGFDTFCPLGPWIETAELVGHVSAAMTLLPGDVILTGTPAGVGSLAEGDEVSVTIEGIGTLTNRVVNRG